MVGSLNCSSQTIFADLSFEIYQSDSVYAAVNVPFDYEKHDLHTRTPLCLN